MYFHDLVAEQERDEVVENIIHLQNTHISQPTLTPTVMINCQLVNCNYEFDQIRLPDIVEHKGQACQKMYCRLAPVPGCAAR